MSEIDILKDIFNGFNQVRQESGEYAEQEFCKWFNENNYYKDMFDYAEIAPEISYDINLVTLKKKENGKIRIELKTRKATRSLKLFQSCYPAKISVLPKIERIEHARNTYKNTLKDKFDYLVFLVPDEVLVLSNDYFLNNIQQVMVVEGYEYRFYVPVTPVKKNCLICNCQFETTNKRQVICNSVECRKEHRRIQSRKRRKKSETK